MSPWADTTTVHDTRPVRHHDTKTYSYLPSCRISPTLGWYQTILLGDVGTYVSTTSPRLLPESATVWSQTCSLLIAVQCPLRYQATQLS